MWNLSNGWLIHGLQGDPSHLVCLHHDMTERKEAEEKLGKSEARLAEAQRIDRLGNLEWNVKASEVA